MRASKVNSREQAVTLTPGCSQVPPEAEEAATAAAAAAASAGGAGERSRLGSALSVHPQFPYLAPLARRSACPGFAVTVSSLPEPCAGCLHGPGSRPLAFRCSWGGCRPGDC